MPSENSNYSQFCVSSENCLPYSSQLIVLFPGGCFLPSLLEFHPMHAQIGIQLKTRAAVSSFLELFLCYYSALKSLGALIAINFSLCLFKLNKISRFRFGFFSLFWDPEIATRQNVRLQQSSSVSFFRVLYYLLSNI